MSADRTISVSVITSLITGSEDSDSSAGASDASLDSLGAGTVSSVVGTEQPANSTVVISSVGISVIDFVIQLTFLLTSG
jgi:hypothetical protein